MSRRESFLVRVWLQEDATDVRLRGEVEHVRTGQRRRFAGEAELIHILNTWLQADLEEEKEEVHP